MDPSNNNSFGSFGNNVGTSGQSISSGTAATGGTAGPIVSSGATAVDSDNFVSSEFPRGGLSVGSDGNGRSRKGLVVGIILLVVLLVGGGFGVYAWTSGMFGGESNNGNASQSINPATLKDAFNSYVNYIASGENSNENVTDTEVSNLYFPYFEQIDKDKRANYVKNVETKFTVLSESLNGEYNVELYDADLYFRWFASVYPIDLFDAEKMYLANGYDKARELVNGHYDVRVVNSVFETYIERARDLALYELEIVARADKAGCIVDGIAKRDCYTMTEEESSIYNQKTEAKNEYELLLLENAVYGMKIIYNYVYDMNGGNNA